MSISPFKAILLALIFLSACATKPNITLHTLRLKPQADVKKELENYVQKHQLKAASIVTAVGSLTNYNLRFANLQKGTAKKGYFEIISLAGLLSIQGSHLHLAVSDKQGATIGGHLLEGNLVYTTLEITLVEDLEKEFHRSIDPTFGYKELDIKARK